MRTRVIVGLIMLVFGVVLMRGGAQESEEKSITEVTTTATSIKVELTAREAFRIAETVARDWASDAVLVDLSNFRGSSLPDGRAVRWKLAFNSVSMEKELEIHVSRGKILQKREEKYKERDVIGGEWIDTPQAMDIAFKYFEERPIKNYWLGIGNNKGTIIWYVKCDYDEGVPTWVDINALTGKLIKTREGY
ncbi:MAG: hypothetical protein HQ547_08040 [Candidatus Omnitrophica bacterium]|nr:hypothetical protein [Candidatus Omnitrophota bacterium]